MDLWNWTLKRTLTVVGSILGICALGCATIIQGTEEEVSVDSEPDGATVSVDGDKQGDTPQKFKLERGDSHTITINKEGYEKETYNISNDIAVEWVVVDVVFGLVPIVVDAVTGAWYKLEKTHIDVELKESSSASRGTEYELVIDGAKQVRGPIDPLSRVGPSPYRPAAN